MPWQQHVADVVLELDPLTGRLAYTEFGLTVPRQSGKSVWILAKAVHRASATKFFGPRQRMVYTAQTRLKAREKWEEDYAEMLQTSRAFGTSVIVHKGNGQEHIRFRNRSRFGIEANTEKAGHGGTIDEAYIDEAFAQADGRLEQAFGPAMITRTNKQLGWISTAGWLDGSPYLKQKIAAGREQAQMGVREGLAYFEWAAPEGADPSDREVWRACMPALGYTISEDAIAAELAKAIRERKLNDFRRAYLNQWVPKDVAGDWMVIPEAAWTLAKTARMPLADPVAIGVDVTPDRTWSAIAAAGRRDGGRGVELVDHRPGTTWVPGRLRELVDRHRPCVVVTSDRALADAAEDADLEVYRAGAGDMASAANMLYDGIAGSAPDVAHLGQAELGTAVAGATKRTVGDGWAWDRRSVSVDICPLVAASLALWGLGTPRVQTASFAPFALT